MVQQPEGQNTLAKSTSLKTRAQDLYQKHHHLRDPAFFVVGFIFDILMVTRIDDLFGIIQQAVYLVAIAILISMEVYEQYNPFSWRERMQKIWSYRDGAVHFCLGTLFNTYAIFYFKSSSLLTSIIFLAVIVVVLVANELSQVKKLGPILRFSFLSLCLCSFYICLFPIVLGFIGIVPFLLAQLFTLATHYLLFAILKKKLGTHLKTESQSLLQDPIAKPVLLSALIVQIVFLLMYLTKILPPVPLSAQYIGIYHSVGKENGLYKLGYTRPQWKFWQSGDQTFIANPGDKIHLFTRLFSPARFQDKVNVRWEWKNPLGSWETHDLIPINITGGREEGFRGYTYKGNYTPGSWRVRLETLDQREISRIYFTVEAGDENHEREFNYDLQ